MPHQYVVRSFRLRHFGHTSCFSRPSSISDGSLAQPAQARLTTTGEGAPAALAAGRAAATMASLSAFSAISALRTSLEPAPRSGCCPRGLASSGLKPRSGSATRSPRTASIRVSGVQGSHMRPGTSGDRAQDLKNTDLKNTDSTNKTGCGHGHGTWYMVQGKQRSANMVEV